VIRPRARVVVWRGVDGFRVEYADSHLYSDRLLARGTQIGVEPKAYQARYSLDTRDGFETARLTIDVVGEGWARRLDLLRDQKGAWHASADASGNVELPDPGLGSAAESLGEAVDCDLAFSPLTNTMPVLRDGLHEGGDPRDYEMAWVSLPDLAVRRSLQRYEPVAPGRVRFVSRDSDFRADLELDSDGLVTRYEHMAERVTPYP
jgi:uncharacterized protein